MLHTLSQPRIKSKTDGNKDFFEAVQLFSPELFNFEVILAFFKHITPEVLQKESGLRRVNTDLEDELSGEKQLNEEADYELPSFKKSSRSHQVFHHSKSLQPKD